MLHPQEQAARREWDWDVRYVDNIRFRLRLGKMDPTCRKLQVHNNFVGHTHDNISFEVSLLYFGHGFVGEDLQRFAHRRLVLRRRFDEKVNASVPRTKPAWIIAMPPMTMYFALRLFSSRQRASRSFRVGGRDSAVAPSS